MTRRSATPLIVLLAVLFLASGLYFATLQNVWVDESTQLSGVTLSPQRLVAWLAGAPETGFGVPPDRFPPIGYIVDMACARTLCVGPFGFRLLHLGIAFVGALLTVMLAARRYGWTAAAVTAAILFLSPRLVETGVEIRAYPIFFTITCVQIWMVDRLIRAKRLDAVWVGGFMTLGLLAIYTHFFGLVSTMALFGGLFVARARDRRDILIIVGAGTLTMICAAGLKPFIGGASAISDDSIVGVSVSMLLVFALRLIGHPAMMLSPIMAALFFAGFGTLLVLTLLRIVWISRREGIAAREDLVVALVVALVLGLSVTLVAAQVVHGFNPLKVSYSIWTFPVLALLAGAACAPRLVRWLQFPASMAALVFGVTALWNQGLFIGYGRWFVHGPGDAIAKLVGDHPVNTVLIYRGQWAYGYYPMMYRYRGQLSQWLSASDGSLHAISRAGDVDPLPINPAAFKLKRLLLFVDIKTHNFRDLRTIYLGERTATQIAAGDFPPLSDHPLDGFVATGRTVLPGLYFASITSFERTDH